MEQVRPIKPTIFPSADAGNVMGYLLEISLVGKDEDWLDELQDDLIEILLKRLRLS
jgi:hypothetical protein